MDDVKSYLAEDHKIWRSPNFEGRGEVAPSILVLHYTGMQSAKAALERLCDPLAKVSAHYVVDEGGKIYPLVDENMRAWHAGASYWRGERDINSHSIGIEIVNPGHEFGYKAFSSRQMEAVRALCLGIQARHDIVHVLGHSDIAPERKEDPGELFPWRMLAQSGIGVWPDEDDIAGGYSAMLDAIGYDPSASDESRIIAFQRHFVPEVFDNETQGQICDLTRARLTCLHRLLRS